MSDASASAGIVETIARYLGATTDRLGHRLYMMDDREDAELAAAVFRERNALDARLGRLLDRPVTTGHIGEWIAARIFDIELENAANVAGYDGRVRTGAALTGRTVNVKAYAKHEGMLDVNLRAPLDYCLVFAGRKAAAMSSRGTRTVLRRNRRAWVRVCSALLRRSYATSSGSPDQYISAAQRARESKPIPSLADAILYRSRSDLEKIAVCVLCARKVLSWAGINWPRLGVNRRCCWLGWSPRSPFSPPRVAAPNRPPPRWRRSRSWRPFRPAV